MYEPPRRDGGFLFQALAMVVRIGPLATLDREPRQARKGATVTVDAGAGVWLVRATALTSASAA